MKRNDNCLQGMRCPKCKSLGPFHILTFAMARVFDDGIESTGAHEWDEASFCACEECGHSGDVHDFSEEGSA